MVTKKAAAILALETKLAEAQWPREKRRNRDLTLNQIQRNQLSTEYPGFDWDTYIAQDRLSSRWRTQHRTATTC